MRLGRLLPRTAGTNFIPVALGILPALLLLLAFVGLPIIGAIRLSFSKWAGIGPVRWIGLSNYIEILSDPQTLRTLWTTTWYAAASATLIVVLALFLAAAVSGRVRGSVFYRIVWFLPGIAPAAAAAIFWANAFQPNTGAINVILGAIGLGASHAWLATSSTALLPVIVVTVWGGVGFAFLILLGAIEQIEGALYEASTIDGATKFQQFRFITLPMVRPTMVILWLLEFIWAFNGFTIVWAMTRGGPGNATATLPVVVYKEAFQFTHFGPATALAVVGGVFLLSVGLIALRIGRTRQ